MIYKKPSFHDLFAKKKGLKLKGTPLIRTAPVLNNLGGYYFLMPQYKQIYTRQCMSKFYGVINFDFPKWFLWMELTFYTFFHQVKRKAPPQLFRWKGFCPGCAFYQEHQKRYSAIYDKTFILCKTSQLEPPFLDFSLDTLENLHPAFASVTGRRDFHLSPSFLPFSQDTPESLHPAFAIVTGKPYFHLKSSRFVLSEKQKKKKIIILKYSWRPIPSLQIFQKRNSPLRGQFISLGDLIAEERLIINELKRYFATKMDKLSFELYLVIRNQIHYKMWYPSLNLLLCCLPTVTKAPKKTQEDIGYFINQYERGLIDFRTNVQYDQVGKRMKFGDFLIKTANSFGEWNGITAGGIFQFEKKFRSFALVDLPFITLEKNDHSSIFRRPFKKPLTFKEIDLLIKQEGLKQKRLEQARLEERLKEERLKQKRLQEERLKEERLKQERLKQERLEQERLERLKQEHLEQERLKQERLEQERLERSKQERLEQERLERLKQERLEQERLEEKRLKEERSRRVGIPFSNTSEEVFQQFPNQSSETYEDSLKNNPSLSLVAANASTRNAKLRYLFRLSFQNSNITQEKAKEIFQKISHDLELLFGENSSFKAQTLRYQLEQGEEPHKFYVPGYVRLRYRVRDAQLLDRIRQICSSCWLKGAMTTATDEFCIQNSFNKTCIEGPISLPKKVKG